MPRVVGALRPCRATACRPACRSSGGRTRTSASFRSARRSRRQASVSALPTGDHRSTPERGDLARPIASTTDGSPPDHYRSSTCGSTSPGCSTSRVRSRRSPRRSDRSSDGTGPPTSRSSADGFGYGEACRLAEAANIEVVAGPFFNAEPSSPATAAAWREICEQHPRRTPSGECPSTSSSCACTVRRWRGDRRLRRCADRRGPRDRRPGVAIGVLLDLHANVTSAMCRKR